MKIDQLLTMQRTLDERIVDDHRLHERDLTEEKLLALYVEVAELANETRCFKYWSLKPASPDEVILEEYVDGLHFILSLGITLGHEERITPEAAQTDNSLVTQFMHVFESINALKEDRTQGVYETLFNHYLTLGALLGYNEEAIEAAYMKKNEVNHDRQDTGY